MLGQQFYNETMRKVVVGYGTMFNNINLVRMNSAGDNANDEVPCIHKQEQVVSKT